MNPIEVEVYSPLDGRLLGRYAKPSAAEVRETVARIRRECERWSGVQVAERARAIGALRRLIHERTDDIVDILHATTGKVPTEALLGEIYPCLQQLRYYEKHAEKILAGRRVPTSPLAYPLSNARVEQRPYGVVALISPWNFPFQLSLIPAATALLAGNGVCLKPSELSLPVGGLIRDLVRGVDELAPLLAMLPGDGDTGRLLLDARPDLVFFTGSVATGRQIMALAARNLTPLILELGGKDAMIVFDDAPRERSVNAALYGAFSVSGQVCVAVERAYVQRGFYREFVEAVVAATAKLRVGADGDFGAIAAPRQIAIIEDHYRDAVDKGARVSGPLRREGAFLHPVVLWDVDHGMKIMREETFGPLLPIMPFDSEEEAVKLANDSEFGLNGSIWTQDAERGRRVAARLEVGGCAVNDVIKHVGHPGMPFGGVKHSGFGRYRGPEGLLAFTRPVSILANAGHLASEPNWFPYSEENYQDLRRYLDFVHGEGGGFERLRRNWRALNRFGQQFAVNFRRKTKQ